MTLALRPKPSPRPKNCKRRLQGFTLLEVLAAVAILAIWYVVIAAVATDGLRKQGISIRSMEASEIASRIISEIEATTLDGSAPEHLDEESEEGNFSVRVLVLPFDFAGSEDADPVSEPGTDPDLKTLLKTEMPGFTRHMVSIHVNVSWPEGQARRAVNRTSFAFNLETARKIYPKKEDPESEETSEAEDEEDEEEDFL
jgi:prepilin-type N-terminal cleavage/methylation domain-containing protein